jgi:uncharacterized membrane protein HdeD (DUF308 family)
MVNEQQIPTPEHFVEMLRQNWAPVMVAGIVQVLLGSLAIAVPQVATVVGTEFLGILLILGGVTQLTFAFRLRAARSFGVSVLAAGFTLAAGTALLALPKEGAIAITLVVAASLIAEGAMRIIGAFRVGISQAGVGLPIAGLAGMAVGLLLWWEWPSDAVWAVGLLLGANLVGSGLALVALAFKFRGPGAAPPAVGATN